MGINPWPKLVSLHFINPRKGRRFGVLEPQKPMLFALVHTIQRWPSTQRVRATSANHHCAIFSILVGTRPFSLTISSHTGPLSFIISPSSSICSSGPWDSTPNCYANTVRICFHLKTSPLLQLNASFFAHGSTAAHIWCSATRSASEASQYSYTNLEYFVRLYFTHKF